jgi:PAS domain S-box-containing protein
MKQQTQHLHENDWLEKALKALIEHAEICLCVNGDGKVINVFSSSKELPAKGQPLAELLPRALFEAIHTLIMSANLQRRIVTSEYLFVEAGKPLSLQITVTPSVTNNNHVFVRNIADERRQRDDATRESNLLTQVLKDHAQAEQVLRRQKNYLESLHQMTIGMLRKLDSTQLLQNLIENVCQLLECTQGYISILSKDEKEMRVLAGIGKIYDILKDTPQPATEGMTGEVIATGKLLAVKSYAKHKKNRNLPYLSLEYPVAVAPLYLDDKVIGVMGVARQAKNKTFGAEEIEILNRYAQVASVIYQNARLLQSVSEQQEFDARIINLMGQGLVIVDPNGAITLANPTFLKMLGYNSEEVAQKQLKHFVFNEDVPLIEKNREVAQETREDYSFECRFVHRNQTTIHTLLNSVPFYNNNDFAGEIIVITDLSLSRQHENQMHLFESAVINANDAIVLTELEPSAPNRGRRIIYVNAAFERMFGYEASEVIGRSLASLQGPQVDRDQIQKISRALIRCEPVRVEFINFRKDRKPFWQESSYVPVRNEQGRFTHWVIVMRDTTERKEAQDALQEAKNNAEEASNMKSRFIATMSHELRTPMNAVLGYTDLLLDMPLNAEQREYAKIIYESGNSLLEYINELLEFSRMEAGRFKLDTEDFDLVEMVEHVVTMLKVRAKEKNLYFFHRISLDLPRNVHGDPKRLRQLLVNLCGNAIKFTSKGMIELNMWRIANDEPGQISIRCEIKDTGIGISKEAQKNIFEPFVQGDTNTSRNYGGTGLGLAISRNLVEMMDGEIGVTSELGLGSTFWFTIILDVA